MAAPKPPEKVYQFKATLSHIKPPIWRRFQVPETWTLEELHVVLQLVMGWEDYHLWEFEAKGTRYGPPSDDMFSMDNTEDASDMMLKELGLAEKSSINYMYDMGDGWDHKLLLEKILPIDPKGTYPICLDGRRACPPEDSGGPYMYPDLLAALADPEHPEHDERIEWMGDGFDPEAFDLEEINEDLSTIEDYLEERDSLGEGPDVFSTTDPQQLYTATVEHLSSIVRGSESLPDGFALRFESDPMTAILGAQYLFIAHIMHPSLKLALEIGPADGPIVVRMTGPAEDVRAAKESFTLK